MGFRVKRFSVLLDKLFGETDRDSEFWKKKIEEIKRVNPNHPRIKTYEQQLQYALEEECGKGSCNWYGYWSSIRIF